MGKVSSNAGKHPYLRAENAYLFDRDKYEIGIRYDPKIQPRFVNEVDTEYKDANNSPLSFNDIVHYKDRDYKIDYEASILSWVIVDINDEYNFFTLKKVANSVILVKK